MLPRRTKVAAYSLEIARHSGRDEQVMKPKIFIDGEHGTTGLQIRTRLARRADLDVLSIPEAERRNMDMRADFLKSADVAILCLPDDASREAVSLLEGKNSTRIIDTSTAFRVHPDWAYGFAELDSEQRDKIAEARLVANPGCYPTGAIAQMEDAAREDHISAPHFLYGLNLQHKHVPEMQKHGLLERRPIFSPSVGRFAQGMIVQVPLHLSDLNGTSSLGEIHATLEAQYAGQDIVQVVPLAESAKLARLDPTELNDTDLMKLYVFGTEGQGQVNLVALLDNLGKGASGAAVQNMDIMLGLKH